MNISQSSALSIHGTSGVFESRNAYAAPPGTIKSTDAPMSEGITRSGVFR